MKVPKGFAWLAEVDLSALPDDDVRATVEAQLRELLAYPLRDIGKTKARATAELLGPVEPAVLSHLAPVEGLSILTLQTPALLLNPEGLSEASTEEHLRQRYEETWRKHLPGLTLRRYFARQTLAGGVYLHHRFLAGREYRPFILTDAGSVFVFEGDSPKLGDYLRQGLPNAQWVQHWYGGDCAEADLWKHCPYIRENGFGEIALNLSSHTEYNPPEEIYHAVHTLEN